MHVLPGGRALSHRGGLRCAGGGVQVGGAGHIARRSCRTSRWRGESVEVGRDHHLVITQVYTGHGGLHVAEASEPRLDQGAGELRLDSEFVLPEVELEVSDRLDVERYLI